MARSGSAQGNGNSGLIYNIACAFILSGALNLGCGHASHTSAVISAGTAASMAVQSYYDHLSTMVVEWWAYQTAFDAIQDVNTSKSLTDAYHERLAGIQARATMAARLTSLYEALALLRDPKAADPAITAAQNLGKSLTDIPKMPGVDLPTGLGQMADFLVNIQRSRDFRAANTDLVGGLVQISNLFVAEREAYLSINKDHDRTRHALVQSLAQRKLVNTTPLLEHLKLGVPWAAGMEDETTRKLALAVDNITTDRSMTAWSCATEETSHILKTLADGHLKIAKGKDASPVGLLLAQTRAKDCLTAYDGVAQ